MKLADYLDQLCWSQADLARAAGISAQSIQRSLSGNKLTRRTALAIVTALSEATGKKLQLSDISDLKVTPVRRRQKPAAGKEKEMKVSPAQRKKLPAADM